MDYRLLTVASFLGTHDRDVLELQDNPTSYINEVEAELEVCYPMGFAFDRNGNKVWPVSLLREHHAIDGEEQWPEPNIP